MAPHDNGRKSAILETGQSLRSRLLAGGALNGAWLTLGSSVAAEIAASAGFDWLLFDHEHGTAEYSDLLHQLQALQGADVGAIVRVPAVHPATFKRILDLGANGLMIPNVETADEARCCVAHAHIPPTGLRGAAQTTRASGYGRHYEAYLREANASTIIVAQIESREGVRNAAEIAAIDGIDVLFIGPTDLGVDLGVSGDRVDGVFREAVVAVAAAASRAGKAAGVLVRNLDQARLYHELGYRFLALGSDRGLIASGMRANADELRRLQGPPSLKAVP